MDSAHPTRHAELEDRGDARPPVLQPRGGIPHAIHAAANFSIEPLQEVVDSLGRDLGISMSSAPFDHVLQSLYGQAGAPPEAARELLLLLSLEDWCRRDELADRAACEAARAAGASARFLPNGQQIMELHEYETDYLYGEIFDRRDYLPPSLKLPPGAAVIDAGANIGMFSLFVLSHSPDARVIAIEPSPVTAKICEANLSGRGSTVVLQQGVGERAGLQRFTHYEGATVFSGFHADVARDRKALEAAIQNEVRAHGGETAAALAAEFVGGRLKAVAADVLMTSISDLIDEHHLDFVDLLKIDAEHSEASILRGIRKEHWPRVRQIVVETHDDDGDESGWIRRHLAANGFELSSAVDSHLANSGLSLLYAVRPGPSGQRSLPASHPAMLGLRERVDTFEAALRAFRIRSSVPVHLVVGPYTGGGSVSDHVRVQLDRAAHALRAACDNVSGVYFSDWKTVSAAYPVPLPAADESAREAAIPYSPQWYAAVGAWALRHYAARHRLPHKVVAVDADNTLWQGACAELGTEGVEFSPATLALQAKLRRLKKAGYLLVLISKNVPEDVWQVFEQRPEMLLHRDDFAVVEINWKAKSANAVAAIQKLGLNADSLIFIDDNEIECAEVKAALPTALVIRFSDDRDEAMAILDHHWALDCVSGAVAPINRTASALEEATRADVRANSASFRAFVEDLGLQVRCDLARPADVERLAELSRRTNQFNLHPQVQPEAALRARMENGSDRVWKVTARDKFGDYGTVGLIAASTAGSYCVDQFLLSCRALGRGVEQQMLLHVVRDAQAVGHDAVELHCRRTDRNEPAMAFVAAIGRIDEPRSLATIAADKTVQARLQDLDEWFAAKPSAGPAAATRDTTLLDDRYRDDDWLLERLQTARTPEAIAGLVWPEYRDPGAQIEGSETEREIARVWESALGKGVTSLDVDFFSLGGTSLRLVQVIGDLGRRGYRQLSIKEAYRATNVRAMAAAVGGRATAGGDQAPLPAVAGEGDRDLSLPEQALWFEHQKDARSSLYVTVVPLLLDPPPDAEAIRAAWDAVCAEHALLRTTYRLDGRRSVATPWPESISPWRVLDGVIWDLPEAFEYVRRRSKDPIDLGRSPVSIDVLAFPDARCLVLLRIHHIVADFQSLSIILRAFGTKLAGSGAALPATLASAYAVFATAAAASPGGRGPRPAVGGDGAAPWWVRAGRGSATGPMAETNPIVAIGRLPRRAEDGIAAAAALHRVSPLSVLLAGFVSFVHGESGPTELCVGTPVSLRDPSTYRDTVGNFAILANLRVGGRQLPFGHLVQDVHRTIGDTLSAVHSGASEEIAGDDVSTTFAYHEHLASDPVLRLLPDGEVSAPYALGPSRARLMGITPQVGLAPLGIDAFEDEEGLVVVLKCRAGTLGRPEAEALMERLIRHLGEVLRPGKDGAVVPATAPAAVAGGSSDKRDDFLLMDADPVSRTASCA